MKPRDIMYCVRPQDLSNEDGHIYHVILFEKMSDTWDCLLVNGEHIQSKEDRLFQTEKEAVDFAVELCRANLNRMEDVTSRLASHFKYLYGLHL